MTIKVSITELDENLLIWDNEPGPNDVTYINFLINDINFINIEIFTFNYGRNRNLVIHFISHLELCRNFNIEPDDVFMNKIEVLLNNLSSIFSNNLL